MALETVYCPQIINGEGVHCGILAEVVRRDSLESTDGPVEHIGTRCVAGHVLYGPVQMLDVLESPEGARELPSEEITDTSF